VIIQFACLAGIAVTGPWIARHPLLLAVEALGIGLGLWAVAAMRPGNFNIVPDVKAGGRFVRGGPYAWIRHPMYSSLLIASGALVLDDFTWLRAGLWMALLVDLVVKLSYEERLLIRAFPAYAAYQSASSRLIPWIY
jgi:protein-S-isoprenylcysteine O-methyltransferase Ste14